MVPSNNDFRELSRENKVKFRQCFSFDNSKRWHFHMFPNNNDFRYFHEKIKWNSANVLVLATPIVDISKCFLITRIFVNFHEKIKCNSANVLVLLTPQFRNVSQ